MNGKDVKDFCRLYPIWQAEILDLKFSPVGMKMVEGKVYEIPDPVFYTVNRMKELGRKISLLESTAFYVYPENPFSIIDACCYGASYAELKTCTDNLCGRDKFYRLKHKFYDILEVRIKNSHYNET